MLPHVPLIPGAVQAACEKWTAFQRIAGWPGNQSSVERYPLTAEVVVGASPEDPRSAADASRYAAGCCGQLTVCSWNRRIRR